MKNKLIIDHLELFKVPPRWLFLKLVTKEGIIGWGEPIVEGKADTVAACVKEVEQYIIGQSAHNIGDLWQVLYRGGFYRGGPILMSAIAGIDQALWDIKGKALGVPVYQLLGGPVRYKMKMYCWIGGDNPKIIIEQAHEKIRNGFKAIKMNAIGPMEWISTQKEINKVEENIRQLRSEFGDDLEIGLDFHGRVHKGMVKKLLDQLGPYNPMFIEEPVLTENFDTIQSLIRYNHVPIATGERMYSRWDFKNILHSGVVDIIQPDLSHAGGISEVFKIASMAEAYDVAVAPHCPLGPISLAAALTIDFTCINAFIQESSIGIHYNQGFDLLDYVSNPEVFNLKDGYIELFDKPGLGIEINETALKKAQKVGHSWSNPIWRLEDGSITEW